MQPSALPQPARDGANSDPSQVAAVAGFFGLRVLDEEGIDEARRFAASLIGEGIAPTASYLAVQRIFPASVFGFREGGALTGVLSAFPLTASGYLSLREGTFNAIDVDAAWIAAPRLTPAAYYGWGFAATTREGGRAVVKASVEIHRRLYWATPTFARAVTDDGVRALTSIGFRSTSQTGLLAIAPAASVSVI